MIKQDIISKVLQGLRKALQKQASDGPEIIIPAIPENPPIPSGHFHSAPEIFIQVGGYTDFTLPWAQFRLPASQVCIIPAYTPHEESFCHWRGQFDFIIGSFFHGGISWHESVLDEKHHLRSTPSVICRIHQITRLIQLCEQGAIAASCSSKYGKIQQKGAGLLALSAILDAMENVNMLPKAEHPKVSWCKRLIMDHLAQGFLCVKYLAKMTECSPNYLSTLFHQETRTCLNDYITTRRLERVQGLLKHSTMNIEEIANASGYDDPGYMTRVFVKKFGLTPRAYRLRSEHT
jgi:AraC-like DNA-binding protein